MLILIEMNAGVIDSVKFCEIKRQIGVKACTS